MPCHLVAIVDDDEAVRLSTCSVLKRAGFAVRMFGSGDDFLNSSATGQASCILLDVQMPGNDGLAVLRALGDRGDSPPVIVITGHGDITVAVDAMKLGACDFMEKPYEAADLLASVERAIAIAAKRGDARTVRIDARTLVTALTQRQRQVLQGIMRGLQNKIIAYELGLSIRTIEAYRAQLMTKLGVRGTAEAVRLALTAGFLDDAPASSARG